MPYPKRRRGPISDWPAWARWSPTPGRDCVAGSEMCALLDGPPWLVAVPPRAHPLVSPLSIALCFPLLRDDAHCIADGGLRPIDHFVGLCSWALLKGFLFSVCKTFGVTLWVEGATSRLADAQGVAEEPKGSGFGGDIAKEVRRRGFTLSLADAQGVAEEFTCNMERSGFGRDVAKEVCGGVLVR
ncbi:hypothetical protein FB451DRAFT_1253507 [Mycena latifolia]|nr:hypothetical protein FB451DRAFT_1253507 [Mycena latifolia]